MNNTNRYELRVRSLTLVVAILSLASCTQREISQPTNQPASISNLAVLVESPPDRLQQLDIARANLLCAEGLSGAEHLDISASLATIDQMAARVRSEIERHGYRFQKNPAEFENSEGFFRMMMLMVVLAEDFRVHYTPNKIGNIASANALRG